jgi:DDE superfamily endonuclease
MVMDAIDSDRFVFVDECSSNTSLAPLYGWSRKGERAYQKAPRNWGKNITLISSIGKEGGVGASLVVEGSTNGTVFQTYLEDVLLPTLRRDQVVLLWTTSRLTRQRG